jgi:DNA replication protein DnaC
MLLDNFRFNLPGVDIVFKHASEFAMGQAPFIWLVIYGRPGNGKTHLAKGIGIEALKRGKAVKYYYVPSLLAEMRKGMDTNTTEQLVDEASLCGLLILDDLGAENPTAWAGTRIEEIINRRYEANKELVVTTNKGLSSFPKPILSRFMDIAKCQIVENKGADYRKNRR